MAKIEIDKRARGKSEHLLHGYLAQKWFFSVTGKDQQKRFEEICSVLKQHSYTEIREMTSKQLEINRQLKDEYTEKLKSLKKNSS